MIEYAYTKSPVSVDRLTQEIQSSAIVTALDHISTVDSALSIFFKDNLSNTDKTTLDSIVSDHNGQPLDSNVPAKVVQVLGQDTFSIWTQGVLFTAVASQTTFFDYLLTELVFARGGVLCSFNAVPGDWISVNVIDKDNVIGLGGTPDNPTILSEYIPKWYVMPGQNIIEDISLSSAIPPGLYFRFTYHSLGESNTIVASNLLTYVKL